VKLTSLMDGDLISSSQKLKEADYISRDQ